MILQNTQRSSRWLPSSMTPTGLSINPIPRISMSVLMSPDVDTNLFFYKKWADVLSRFQSSLTATFWELMAKITHHPLASLGSVLIEAFKPWTLLSSSAINTWSDPSGIFLRRLALIDFIRAGNPEHSPNKLYLHSGQIEVENQKFSAKTEQLCFKLSVNI